MKELMTTLLSLSLWGSVLGLLLLAVRPLLRRVGGTTAAYYLWLVVLLRLAVPVGVGIPLSLPQEAAEQGAVSPPSVQQTAPSPALQTPAAEGEAIPPVVEAEPQPQPAPETPAPAPAPDLWNVLGACGWRWGLPASTGSTPWYI